MYEIRDPEAPATEKQISYIRSLGGSPDGLNKGQASQLIDKLIARRDGEGNMVKWASRDFLPALCKIGEREPGVWQATKLNIAIVCWVENR